MVTKQVSETIQAVLFDGQSLSLADICLALNLPAEAMMEMIEYGIVEAKSGQDAKNWKFSARTLRQTRIAVHLQRDFHINLEGLGLAMNLLEEVEQLRHRVQFLEDSHPDV